MPSRSLVLDANILIRAVLGERVRRILQTHAEKIFPSLFRKPRRQKQKSISPR